MSLTVTGLLVIALGVWCQFGNPARVLLAMMAMTLFEAADAADLTALGGASITPAKLFLAFLALRVVSMRSGVAALAAELAPRRVFVVYLALLAWVLASGILFPRLFEGATSVFSLDRSTIDVGAVPLRPSGGNITQGVYALGSFAIALCVAVLARRDGGYAVVLKGLLLVSALDIFFALADIVTAATHTGFLLDAVHTGSYAFLTSDEAGGLKRISGSFSEASSFATFSLELLAVNLTLLVHGIRPRTTGCFSGLLALFLVLSTSSTAYVGLAVFAAAFGIYAVYRLARYGERRAVAIFAATMACGGLVVCLVLLFAPGIADTAWTILDLTIFSKGTTDSGIERASFNTQAVQIFYDTWGLGAGIGATRTSNYFYLLLSNLGVVGLVLFAALIIALMRLRPRDTLTRDERGIVASARVGVLAALVPALLIATIFDLGTLFYILVGIVASSSPRAALAASRRSADLPARAVRRSA